MASFFLWPSTLPPQTAMEPFFAPGIPPSTASTPLLSSLGRDPRSQKRAKDRATRHPAHGQSVDGKQTDCPISSWRSPLSPQASAEHGDLMISGKHHPRLRQPRCRLSCAETSPRGPQPRRLGAFPTSPGVDEGSEMGNLTPNNPQAEGRRALLMCARAESSIYLLVCPIAPAKCQVSQGRLDSSRTASKACSPEQGHIEKIAAGPPCLVRCGVGCKRCSSSARCMESGGSSPTHPTPHTP